LSTRIDEMPWNVPVVFADRFFMADRALAEISSLGGYVWAEARDHQDLAAKLKGETSVRVIVSEYIPINAAVLEQAPGLKGVIAYGAGYDHIDVDYSSGRGIQVCNCRGENAQAVAEMTFGLLLCLLRRIHRADRWIREGEWPIACRSLPLWATGQELWGKALGIIGLGEIGKRVTKIAEGFQMKISAYDPFIKPTLNVETFPWKEVLADADILTLHVPLTPKTEKMIDASSLAMMKPGAILVNTSRGGVVDEPALIQALKDGRIGGAALDVLACEPIPGEHPLNRMENVVLSPHMGAMTQEAGERLSSAVSRQARDILEGCPPECLINAE
jgi:phosphoglycerate dehydrogenase-like enzyme